MSDLSPLPARRVRNGLGPVFLLLAACTGETPEITTAAGAGSTAWFSDVARESGLSFEHRTGASGRFLFPEIVGAGGALFDADNDGDLDVYLIQGGAVDGAAPAATNRLYRNELVPTGRLTFTDVTDAAGVGDTGYGMGVTVGDIDNDGDADLYVTNFGDNVLYRNDGRGRFENLTAASLSNDSRWSTSAAFVDIDSDGLLDLFVTNYSDYSVDADQACRDAAGRRDYCAPARYPATSDSLFRNQGNGRFADISDTAGITAELGPGLGVLAADLDADARADIFVANDQQANFLWRNLGQRRFEESGLVAGVAVNADGKAEASMGVTAGDFDGDGDDDLFLTHLTTESNTLYVNDGHGSFADGTIVSGLGSVSVRQTGFGSRWFDRDNDGDLDLFVANGAVAMENDQVATSDYPYEQRDQLFENLGNGRFRDASADAGFAAMPPRVSRGAAFGDVDNDGDIDILVTNNGGPVRLLRNDLAPGSAYLRVRLRGVTANADAQGARVSLQMADGSTRWRRVHVDGSFASANEKTVHFGLGNAPAVEAIGVIWPGGRRELWPLESASGVIDLRESTGQPWPAP